MSSRKFAAMTASLLARKGDAAPSLAAASPRPAVATRAEMMMRSDPLPPPPFPPALQVRAQPAAPVHPTPVHAADDADKPRRIMVTVTADELERLGIAAIKKGLTRHEVVRAALDSYFQKLAAELPQKCNCMANGSCCS